MRVKRGAEVYTTGHPVRKYDFVSPNLEGLPTAVVSSASNKIYRLPIIHLIRNSEGEAYLGSYALVLRDDKYILLDGTKVGKRGLQRRKLEAELFMLIRESPEDEDSLRKAAIARYGELDEKLFQEALLLMLRNHFARVEDKGIVPLNKILKAEDVGGDPRRRESSDRHLRRITSKGMFYGL